MEIEVKAIRSKPSVSVTLAVGTLTLKAHDLAQAAILTALANMFLHGDEELANAIKVSAVRAYDEMAKGEKFKMIPPKKKARA
jgi:hypothetical protein